TYTYPDGPAAMNGADIFRVGIGATGDGTWWRVDWNTLIDPTIPIAEFGVDLDNNPNTGASPGPFHGIELTITMSSRAVTAAPSRGARPFSVAAPVAVDRAARSFVARVPRTVFDPVGSARVQLAAGLADTSGHGFAAVSGDHGSLPNQPPYYNIAF